MVFNYLKDDDVSYLKELLMPKHIKISDQEIKCMMGKIANSQEIFPLARQSALLVQLLHVYEKQKKKEVILLEDLNPTKIPATIVLGAAAEDWPGMSNVILGIVHHKEHNVLFIKGFTVEYEDKKVGVVILCFRLETQEEYEKFMKTRKEMLSHMRDAAQGSRGKCQFLEDEAVKFEIYNSILKRFKELYSSSSLMRVIEESGEVLKFISARSREYLEERDIKELANMIINNYIYQNMIRSGETDEIIKISNFKTNISEMTGITFLCREWVISIEDFLLTLNHIVPDHIIKHHKSFVTTDGILVYRLEIVDHDEKPLNAGLIKSVEKSLQKLVAISHSKKISKLKAVGGFEHYARAIIPFLMEEYKKTQLTQVFIDTARGTEFSINIKLVLVSNKSRKKRIHELSSKVCLIPGVSITSAIPTKVHGKVEVNILRLKVNLSDFNSIKELYGGLKKVIRKIYGDIRDFDEGFREIYIERLGQLTEKLKKISASLIREIFFNIDELYRIEMSLHLTEELIKLCHKAIEKSKEKPGLKVKFMHKNLPEEHRTIVAVSYERQKRLMSKLIMELKDVEIYFTRIEWNQRSYLLMVLSKNKEVVEKDFIGQLKERVNHFIK
ncbi:MAG: hypothetical protein QG657_3781 [Acidobacteriota bacterium]|nr:hypothetical protein [Acidobacteriota bacterium]